jgi:cysteine desulfurase
VIFTSGGTEADNLAIIGAALAGRDKGRAMRAVVTAIEHKAILAAAHEVVHLGGSEEILPVAPDGRLSLDVLDAALARDPSVVSVMWVNNEVGVVQPVDAIASRCHDAGVPFHTDAVQAFGKIPIALQSIPLSLLTLSGHKIGAPKGIGALVVRARGWSTPSSTAAASSMESAPAPRTSRARWPSGARPHWPGVKSRAKRCGSPRSAISSRRACARR